MGTVNAYAKINLYLDVISRGEDSFHAIESVMQTVSLSDSVFVDAQISDVTEISLSCSLRYVPCDSRNLAWRAAAAFLDKCNLRAKVVIDIKKNIPVSAGMAGGSSDAAAVLRELNSIFGQPLSRQELLGLGASLGSDIPFCIVGGTVICRGRGEILSPCSDMPHCYIVTAKGGRGISTPAAYARLDELYDNFKSGERHASLPTLTRTLDSGDLSLLENSLYNVFEDAILPDHKEASEIKRILSENGGVSMMSGSGPSVFGLFHTRKKAFDASKLLREKGYFSSVCEPIGAFDKR